MTRDAKKQRDRQAASVRRYHDKVMREVLAGERPYNSIPKVNRKRKAKRAEAGEVYGPGYVWMVGQPCEESGHPDHRCIYYPDRNLEAHHLKHVGSGGKDAFNLIPACHALHDEFHARPLSAMEAKYGKDYHACAHVHWCAYLDSIGEIAA